MKNILAVQLFLHKHINIVKIVLVMMYLVGFVGLNWEVSRPIFLQLVTFNLWVSLALLLFFHEYWSRNHIVFFSIIFLVGFLVEVVGVKTGVIFGQYSYGPTLGFKLLEVPIAIGANWLVLTYVFTYFTKNLFSKFIKNKLILASLASFFMVLLDILIEPIAINYDFWQWQNNHIPIQNYIAWFFVALAINSLILHKNLLNKNKIAVLMLTLQIVFFLFHNLFLSNF